MALSGIDSYGVFLLGASVVLAFAAGVLMWGAFDQTLSIRARRRAVFKDQSFVSGFGLLGSFGANAEDATEPKPVASDLDSKVIGYSRYITRALKMGKCRRLAPPFFALVVKGRAGDALRLAGIGSEVDLAGFCESSIRLSLAGGIVGLILGAMFSPALGVLLLLVGGAVGLWLPMGSAGRLAERRAGEMERHLPEMLDVVALGMRSGMSFDSSLLLYERHFKTSLSKELANLQRQWSSGLAFRDDALRDLASTYDSVVFGRVVETIIRSVRYGSSMVESLESDAAEARAAYQASREERAAKAPVKMMVPTGTLILPAMLILVLGPVLLELMDGGL